jgi:hypothetical protein
MQAEDDAVFGAIPSERPTSQARRLRRFSM